MTEQLRWWQWRKRAHCPHADLQGIYGDQIFMAGFRRLHCRRCGRLLDGPVALAEEKLQPGWTWTPDGHDDRFEYTTSSDCDGTLVAHLRRIPMRSRVVPAGPWQPIDRVPDGLLDAFTGEIVGSPEHEAKAARL